MQPLDGTKSAPIIVSGGITTGDYGMVDRDLQAQLKGWSLTTAEIMYRMPDYRDCCKPSSGRDTISRRAFRGSSALFLVAQSRRAAAHRAGHA